MVVPPQSFETTYNIMKKNVTKDYPRATSDTISWTSKHNNEKEKYEEIFNTHRNKFIAVADYNA